MSTDKHKARKNLTPSSTPSSSTTKRSIWYSHLFIVIAVGFAVLLSKPTVSPLFASTAKNTPQKVSSNVDFMVQVMQKTGGKNICSPAGFIKGTCMDFENVETENKKISKILSKLVKTTFFKTIKVDLNKPCKLWDSNDFCYGQACSVEGIASTDVPEKWAKKPSSSSKAAPVFGMPSKAATPKQTSDYAVVDDEYGKGEWIDLVANPEKFTGYTGTSANQIWLSIYKNNCFGVAPFIQDDSPFTTNSQLVYPPKQEKRFPAFLQNLATEDNYFSFKPSIPHEINMFYSIISGLHASTSTHICHDYFDKESNSFKPNLGCFIFRIGSFPQRLNNIYFNYVFILRAVQKMSHYLKDYDYSYGNLKIDKKTKKLVHGLVDTINNISHPFNETKLFNNENTAHLLADVKNNFYNISQIMDCTDCVTCKLWGKTQVLGLATALKSLFSTPEAYFDKHYDLANLKRNEIVSLIVTLNQLSQSLNFITHFRGMYQNFIDEHTNSQNHAS
ncbi:hypothetical protein BB561_001633 [Smittium simulii]|uniref:Endoplasmic reticulum oxidoreductin 1 n=1 Tax=Smittium simulii TaxID=133385 RepID=A0A2T9YTS8_9FUNG|nr:hypothetical protein BB561_001633 [Smittium simulii]